MMQTIWKYPLGTVDSQTLLMPEGARVLCVQLQGGQPTLWALVDPTAQLAERQFRVFGTGRLISEPVGEYVGTYQLEPLGLVFHIFEVAS